MSRELPLLKDGTKEFRVRGGRRVVFKDLNLSMKRGSCLVFLGPNAAGKSTLMHALLGLESLSRGEVLLTLGDADLLASVLQDYRSQLLPWASVEQNLLLPLGGGRAQGFWQSTEFLGAAQSVFERMGYKIPLSARAGTLSGGQQQILVLVRAWLFRPSVWILDEPVSAVDIRRREQVYSLFDEQLVRGRSLIIVTHSVDEVVRLANRVLVFDDGMRIVEDLEIRRPPQIPRESFVLSSEGVDLRKNIVLRLTKLP